MAPVPTSADLAGLYRDTRVRLADMIGSLGAEELAAPVPTCPGWSVADVVSRGALGRPGARDTEVVRAGAEQLIGWLRPPAPVLVRLEDAELLAGPDGETGNDAEPLVLETTRFETLRWRLGRRSRTQLATLAWSADPTPVLDHLVVFGPSREDIHE